jgi:type I restriction enzyme, S subunit
VSIEALNFGKLPESWKICSLGELVNPNRPRIKPAEKPDLPFIGMDHIEAHTMRMVGSVPAGTMKSSSVHFQSGDVLYGRLRPYLNKVFLPSFEGLCSAEFIVFPEAKDLSNRYLQYFLNWSAFVRYANSLNAGDRPRVKFEQLALCEIPVPPLPQQKRIVAKIEELFSHIDAGIVALNNAKQLLKQYRQSVLKAAVTGELTREWREKNAAELVPAGELLKRIITEREIEFSRKIADWKLMLDRWKSDGEQEKKPVKPQKLKNMTAPTGECGAIPLSWRWIKLGNLAVEVFDGPFGSNLKGSDYVDEGVRVIRLENIGNLEFKNEKVTHVSEEKYQLLRRHTVSSGDIIFSSFVVNGTRVVVLPEYIDRALNKADCFCIHPFGDSISAEFLSMYLSTAATFKRLENQVHGATRPRINTTQLKDLDIAMCCETEQLEIVSQVVGKFTVIDRLKHEMEIQLIQAEKSKQAILSSAFSGGLC